MEDFSIGCWGVIVGIALVVWLIIFAIKILGSIGLLFLYLIVLIIQVFLSVLLIALTAFVFFVILAAFIWIVVNLFREFERRNFPTIASLAILSLITISGLSIGFWLKIPMVQASDAWLNDWSKQASQLITTINMQLSQSQTTQHAPLWNFPLTECGDKNLPGVQHFYPVFVNKNDKETLGYIQQNYCSDAFIKPRKLTKRKAIQVASFLNKDTALKFARIMIQDQKISSGEVAEPTLN